MIVSFIKHFSDEDRDLVVFFLVYENNIYRCSQCFDYGKSITHFQIQIKRDYPTVMSVFELDVRSLYTRDVTLNTVEQTRINWDIFKSNVFIFFEGFLELTLDDIIENKYMFFNNSRIVFDPKSNTTKEEIKSLMNFEMNEVESYLKLIEFFR